jgi:hypothetical protein
MATFSKPAHSIPIPRHKVIKTNSTDNNLMAINSETPVVEDGGQILTNALLVTAWRSRGKRRESQKLAGVRFWGRY